jgi:hypothetical protein
MNSHTALAKKICTTFLNHDNTVKLELKTQYYIIVILLILVSSQEIVNSAFAQIGKPWMLGLESPSTQFKSGVKAEYVICQPNYFTLIIKLEDNSPACVKQETAKILVERGWGTWIGTSVQQNIPILSNSVKIRDINFTLNYDIAGNGKILDANMDTQSKSLILSLETTSNGTLTVSIPKALLDATKNDRGMGGFTVLKDMQETAFAQIRDMMNERTFSIPFTNGTQTIEIIAYHLI